MKEEVKKLRSETKNWDESLMDSDIKLMNKMEKNDTDKPDNDDDDLLASATQCDITQLDYSQRQGRG